VPTHDAAKAAKHGSKPSYPIDSVDNALRLLLLVAERKRLRLPEASREIDAARSTAHRMLQMLRYHGFVDQDPESKAYTPGPVLINLGLQVVRELDIRAVARPHLQTLVDELGETVQLFALQGTDVLGIESIESPRMLRIGSRTGMVLPAHATASGRALLAELPTERIRELYPEPRLPALTPGTITSRSRLEEELAITHERGYAVNLGELEPEVGAVSAAIRERRGQAPFAVTVAAPASRLPEARIAEIGEAAKRCAAEIAAALPW